MATSPLVAATKPIGGSLSDEKSPADTNYELAMQRIMDALDAREGRNQQDIYLALAQGMLTPGKTGSFGESLGQAAGNVREVQRQQDKETLENAQMRLQIAQAQKAQANRMKALEIGLGGAGGPQKGSETISVGGQQFPAYFAKINPETALRAGIYDPEIGKAYSDYLKLRSEGLKVQPGGYVDIYSPEGVAYKPFGGKPLVERNVPELGGAVKMPEQDAMELDLARRDGDAQKYWDIVNRNTKMMGKPGAAPAATAAPATGTSEAASAESRMTQAQIEAQAAAAKETATQRAKGENTRYQSIMDNGAAASGKIGTYKTMENVVNRKGMDQLLGYFERPDFLSAAGKFIETGRWGSEALREVLQNLGAPQELIDNKMLLNSLVNQVGVEFSRLNKGQGAVSDYERTLYQSLGPNNKDPIGAFRKKVAMLNARAEFERDIARGLRNSKMDADEFVLNSPQYENAVNNYYRTLERIVYGQSGAPARPSAGPVSPEDLRRARDEAKKRMQGG